MTTLGKVRNVMTDYGAQGIGSAHDDWPAFEAAFADIRANGHSGLLLIPQPPSYYWCTQRLRPGCQIRMTGEMRGYVKTLGTQIRFPFGCPQLMLDGPQTADQVPNGYRCDQSVVEHLSFYSGRADSAGSSAPIWSVGQTYSVNTYVKPITRNGYIARVVSTGASGTVEPTWPHDHSIRTDGMLVTGSGNPNPPPGAVISGDGSAVYQMLINAGITIRAPYVSIQDVAQANCAGSGVFIYGHISLNGDTGGVADNWLLDKVHLDGNDEYGFKIAWGQNDGSGDCSVGSARQVRGGGNALGGIRDESDVGNKYDAPHFEGNGGRPYYFNPLAGTTVVDVPYSEGTQPNYGGTNVIVHGGSCANGWEGAAMLRANAHLGSWLSSGKLITPTLGVRFCAGQYASQLTPQNDGINASFEIQLTDGNGTPTHQHRMMYQTGTGEFSLGIYPFYYLLAWGLTTANSPHGGGHLTIRMGYYAGLSNGTNDWFANGVPSQRYVSLDQFGFVNAFADGGNRKVGDRVDAPSATLTSVCQQVTRDGFGTVPWGQSPGRFYASNGYTNNKTRVRPTDPETKQAWELDMSYASAGYAGATEPAWPANPAVGDTILDGQLRWKYVGVCARWQEYGGVAGLVSLPVSGASTVTLSATSEYYLAGSIQCVGTLTAGIDVVLPSKRGEVRWVYNSTAGGFPITVKTASGRGVVIANGMAATVICDGVNVLRQTPDVAP